ncbi:transcriptional regulator [Solibacillus sp. R5-41]|uniref:LCP family glycopolymer transferase n=1 Tax=Solibacillus sp. R5-41 TaxID=2048654 RepID=UPI000C1282DD|nr:LCP family protein [Solibacillus sp. R5-41]ATP40094.1 transcriptional regulator [Solibacillus sp. R5-41]
MTERKLRNTSKKRSKITKIVLWSLLILALGVGGTIFYYYNSFQNAISKMNTTGDSTSEKIPDILPHIDPFSVLLLGIDERENDTGRTDTMIVVTVNPDLGTMKMLSIPRDSRVEIVGNGTTEKINHAYARGGIPMSIATVEEALDIPIDFYVAVNMEGFLSIIDVLGNIEVNNDMELIRNEYTFPKGNISLNGEEALIFSRIRYEDPRGDFGRQLRQKQLLEALFAKAKNPSILLKLDDIFEVMGDNVSMNFSQKQILALQKLYGKLDKNIEQIQFEKGEGIRKDGLWYYIFDDGELHDISAKLNAHLEEEPIIEP